jgi:hypothetical protein
LLWIEATALSALARSGSQAILPKAVPFWRRAWDWLANLPITQVTYALAFYRACWNRRVGWRGVTYRVLGHRDPGGPGVEALGWDWDE